MVLVWSSRRRRCCSGSCFSFFLSFFISFFLCMFVCLFPCLLACLFACLLHCCLFECFCLFLQHNNQSESVRCIVNVLTRMVRVRGCPTCYSRIHCPSSPFHHCSVFQTAQRMLPLPFVRALVLIRSPYEAILANFNRLGDSYRGPTLQEFSSEKRFRESESVCIREMF